MKSIAFTGHRPTRLGGYDESNPIAVWVKSQLDSAIRRAIAKGFTKFVCGGALGVDTWAAEIILSLRDSHDLTLVIAVPFKGQESKWPQTSRDRYDRILRSADEVVVVSEGGYSPKKLFDRNLWMIDNSDVLIAVWDGSNSGTSHAVRYAKEKSKAIYRIDPTTRKTGW